MRRPPPRAAGGRPAPCPAPARGAFSPLLGLLLACGASPSGPAEEENPYATCIASPYEFSLPDNPTAVFHWPVGSRVRFRVLGGAQDTTLSEAADSALAAWERAAGEELELVRRDFTFGEVLVGWADAELPVDTSDCSPPDSIAATTFCLDQSGTRLRRFRERGSVTPTPTVMVVTLAPALAEEPQALRRRLAHEVGHTLGLFRHSPQAADLMAEGLPQTAVPTCRDFATLRALHRTTATISAL